MPVPNLFDQLARLSQRVRASIEDLEESHLKRWFSIELQAFGMAVDRESEMEELSATMRAVRQLQYMVQTHRSDEPSQVSTDESIYTQTARLPAAHRKLVRETNFSIEPQLLLRPPTPVELFDLVSPTAQIVAYLRSFDTSLAFAKRLSRVEHAQALLRDLDISDESVLSRLSLLFRARYHCINKAIAEHGASQVLEIASGISLRGLHWSRENPGTVYIESDLPALMREKSKVLRNAILEDSVVKRGVLHCCGLDALDLDSLRHALEYTDPNADLVIVTEGLLLYFTQVELQLFLRNMHTILVERPRTVWVVDLVSRQNLMELCSSDRSVAAAVTRIFGSTTRAVIADNPFENEAAIIDVLRQHGLQVRSKAELSAAAVRLSRPAHVTPEAVRAICGSRKIWTIAIC